MASGDATTSAFPLSIGELRTLLRKEREGTIPPDELARLDEVRPFAQSMTKNIPPRVVENLERGFAALEARDRSRVESRASRPAPRAPRARAPRARRVVRRSSRTRSPGSLAGDDPEPALSVIPLAAFRRELELALGGRR
jgi:hypothetical protein